MPRLRLPELSISLAAFATLMALAPLGAHAISMRLCECATSNAFGVPGSTLTLGLRIEGDPGEGIYGLGASVYGYDESVIDFESGEAVPSIFHGVAIPAVGAFDGLTNVAAGALQESAIGASGNRVLIFNGISLLPRTYNPLDPGLDGVVGGGDAQIRVTFRLVSPGTTVLNIGAGYNGDGVVYPGGRTEQPDWIAIPIGMLGRDCVYTPEPSTALLIGLGLVSLAGRARRTEATT